MRPDLQPTLRRPLLRPWTTRSPRAGMWVTTPTDRSLRASLALTRPVRRSR